MNTSPGIGESASTAAAPPDNYLTHAHGFRSWIFTLDHKRIGVMYLVSILSAFLLGGILAMLIRTELLEPRHTIMSADIYNRIFTLHGAIMIFLFIIPGDPRGPGQLRPAPHARGQGRGLPQDEPGQLLPLRGRGSPGGPVHRAGRGRHRLDLLHSLQHHHEHPRRRHGARGLRPRLQLDLHRHQLHRHHPQDASAGHDLVQDAALPLGALRHGHHPGPGHAGPGHHRSCS